MDVCLDALPSRNERDWEEGVKICVLEDLGMNVTSSHL